MFGTIKNMKKTQQKGNEKELWATGDTTFSLFILLFCVGVFDLSVLNTMCRRQNVDFFFFLFGNNFVFRFFSA